MNFKEWNSKTDFSKVPRHIEDRDTACREEGWQACKEEVLKILESNLRNYEGRCCHDDWTYYPAFIKEEIEKL